MLRINSKKIIILLIIILIPICANAISEAALIYLLIEPGAKPLGMGAAYVAQVDDGYAGYWNPGAMAFNRKNQFALMHSNWLGDVIDDVYIEHLAWNNYIEDLDGNLGFHIHFLTYGEQEERDSENKLLGTFTSFEVAMASTYAAQVSQDLGLGVTFKFIWSDLSPRGQGTQERNIKGRALGFAFDIGMKYRNLLTRNLDFGATLQNVGPNITYVNEAQSDPMPINLRLGFSYRPLDSDLYKLTINTDANKLLANDDWVLKRLITAWYDDGGWQELDSTIFSVGTEFMYWNLLSFRAGYIYDKAGSIIGPSYGAGIQYTFNEKYKVSIDFAMAQGGELVDYNKIFSVGVDF